MYSEHSEIASKFFVLGAQSGPSPMREFLIWPELRKSNWCTARLNSRDGKIFCTVIRVSAQIAFCNVFNTFFTEFLFLLTCHGIFFYFVEINPFHLSERFDDFFS